MSIGKRFGIIGAETEHFCKDIVGRSVKNSGNFGDSGGVHCGIKRADKRNSAADGSFEKEVYVMSTGDAQKFRAFFRNKFLVGSNGVFAVFQSGFYIGIGGFKPAYAFRYRSDFRVGEYGGKIFRIFFGIGNVSQFLYVKNVAEFDRFSCGGRNLGIFVPKNFTNAGTDRSMAENCDFHEILFPLFKVAASDNAFGCAERFP